MEETSKIAARELLQFNIRDNERGFLHCLCFGKPENLVKVWVVFLTSHVVAMYCVVETTLERLSGHILLRLNTIEHFYTRVQRRVVSF
jgi:hypothetical protein